MTIVLDDDELDVIAWALRDSAEHWRSAGRAFDGPCGADDRRFAAERIRAIRRTLRRFRVDVCEHGVVDGEWCAACNAEMKAARIENGDV